VRAIYERRPFPSVIPAKRWVLPPPEWIGALWQSVPRRILVAGCGTGAEAFALARRFPRASVVAVDFSPRSIAIARERGKRLRVGRRIRFRVADLSTPRLANATGAGFDLVTCHGVLSYVPAPGRVLANLYRLIASGGALYLGVNGTTHASATTRPMLAKLGFDVRELHDGPRLRDALRLCDNMQGRRGKERIAAYDVGLLAGDLFGPLIHDLDLSSWLRLARRAGFHFQGAFDAWDAVTRGLSGQEGHALFPKARGEVAEIAGLVSPAAFHRLLFTRDPVPNPPWKARRRLLEWRIVPTSCWTVRLPKRSANGRAIRRVALANPAMRIDWRAPEWLLEILRRSDGRRTLAEALARVPRDALPAELERELYVLHQLLVITAVPGVSPSC